MKLYIAGPDVFRPDVADWAENVRALCRREGHEALIPLDAAESDATAIYRNNLRQIGEADAVLANLNPFRGAEPDSGTCVEIGYALALDKPVIGYAKSLVPMRERLCRNPAGNGTDAAGWAVEDFGLPLNLMLAVPLRLECGDIEDALRALCRTHREQAGAVGEPP